MVVSKDGQGSYTIEECMVWYVNTYHTIRVPYTLLPIVSAREEVAPSEATRGTTRAKTRKNWVMVTVNKYLWYGMVWYHIVLLLPYGVYGMVWLVPVSGKRMASNRGLTIM